MIKARVYTIPEAAEVLGIGEKLVRKQIKSGVIPSLRLGRIYRIPICQLERYLAGESKQEVDAANKSASK